MQSLELLLKLYRCCISCDNGLIWPNIKKSIGNNVNFQTIKWNLEVTVGGLRIHESTAIYQLFVVFKKANIGDVNPTKTCPVLGMMFTVISLTIFCNRTEIA